MRKIFFTKAFTMLFALLFTGFLGFNDVHADTWTEDFNSQTSSYVSGTLTINSRVWSASNAGNFGYGSSAMGSPAFVINDDKANAHITSPVLNTIGTVSFKYAYKSGSSSNVFVLQKSTDGSNWTDIETHTLGASSDQSYVLYSYDVNDASSSIYIRILSDDQSGHLFIDDFSVTDFAAASGVDDPDAFSATAFSTSQINLAATANTDGDSILVAYNTSDNFGTPTDGATYASGNSLPSNGTVWYVGLVSNLTNHTALSSGTQYYYKAFSIHNKDFSSGITADATTLEPTITLSTSSLTGLSYAEGNGPSSEKTFTAEGSNLTTDITLTAPSNYEISKTSGSSFSGSITLIASSGSVSSTTIYVRLKTGLTIGDYNGTSIAANSTGATQVFVSCSGSVISLGSIPYSEDFSSSLGDLESFSVSGASKEWAQNSGSAKMNGYNSGDTEEDWLIFPSFNLDNYSNEELTFETNYNYGTSNASNYLKLMYSVDYSGNGDPSSATWIELSYTQPSSTNTFTSSGAVDISGLTGTMVTIAFKYNYNSGSYRQWLIDNINIQSVSSVDDPAAFTATASSTSQIDLTATANVASNSIVVAFNSSNSFGTPTDGTTYNATDAIGSSTVWYTGLASGLTNHTGLTAGTQYFYKVWSVDGSTAYSPGLTADATTLAPSAIVSESSLTGFNYVSGSGPSAEQTFTVEGSNLSANIIVAAVSNYEISTTSGSGFTNSITLTQAGGSVAPTTIFIRLKSALAGATYAEDVTISSTGIADQTVSCNGTVSTPIALPIVESFDAANTPTNWTEEVVTDYDNDAFLLYVTASSDPTALPYEGSGFVKFNSYDCDANDEIRLISPNFSTVGMSEVNVDFSWYEEIGTYSDPSEGVSVEWSIDGTTWNTGAFFNNAIATDDWSDKTYSLPAGALNQSQVYVAFLFHSEYGSNCYLDDLTISEAVILPEPTNHASAFAATSTHEEIVLTWGDNDGTQVADGFVIVGKTGAGAYVGIADGTDPSDDTDWSDNNFNVKVAHGAETYTVTGLDASTTYDFTIYPYTNSGSDIDFKITSAPTVSKATDAAPTIPNLTISEVVDPGNNADVRYVELYNDFTSAIDFSSSVFYLVIQSNGVGYQSVQLTGTLGTNETYVIAKNNASAVTLAYGASADLYSGIIDGNGDDGYFLYYGGDQTTGTLVDAFGVIGTDGTGQSWEYKDKRAVRINLDNGSKGSKGTTVWKASEWSITAADAADATFDKLEGDDSQTLPIELIAFTAEKKESSNLITWVTLSEINNDFFTLERSFDGIYFEEIGQLAGAGNSTVKVRYEFEDLETITTTVYYRLKQTDFNGKYTYSAIISINGVTTDLSIVSLVTSNQQIDMELSYTQSKVLIELYDASGRKVYYQTTEDQNIKINTARFEQGIYFLRVSNSKLVIGNKIIL